MWEGLSNWWSGTPSKGFGGSADFGSTNFQQGTTGAWDSFSNKLGGIFGDTFTQDSMFGDKAWFSPVMQGAGGLMSGWLGMKNYKLGKDALAFQKDAFNKNFTTQGRLVNEQLASKQDALNSLFTPEERATRMSGEDYAKKYGVANV